MLGSSPPPLRRIGRLPNLFTRTGHSLARIQMLIGAHVSIAEGIELAVARAKSLRCETFQIFARSPRSLRAKPLEEDAAKRFRDALRSSDLSKPVIHDNYLINLASPKVRMVKLYRSAFADEMTRAQRLNVPFLVFHPGAHMGRGEKYAVKRIAESLDWCVDNANAPDVTLCLENTAGQGSVVGHTFEQLRSIIDQAEHGDRLAVCFDTCHAFAAGYDIRTERSFQEVLERFDSTIGIGLLRAFHLNDSVGELGSHLDRHQNLGRGNLGTDPFRSLMNNSRFRECPGNIETPDAGGWNKRNLKFLRSLRAV
jgi:deoxyribonuclease-4